MPSPAIDKATGQVVQLPDDQLHEKWKAGDVDLLADHRYQVQLQDGTYGTVPGAQMPAASEAGARFVSPAEAKATALAKQYGGAEGAALAGNTSLLGQFTMGASDQAMMAVARKLEETGIRKPGYANAFAESVQSAQELHPVPTGVGQAGGAIALAAALPGGGLAGAGERGALALTEGLGETGLASVARRGLVQGVKGALEGTQMGVAQANSDDAFSNHRLTAEQALSTIGTNTLWGGALGAGFGAASGGVRALRGTPSVVESLARSGASDADIEAVVGRTLGVEQPAEGLGPKVRQWLGKLYRATGRDAEAVTTFVDGPMAKENVAAALEASAARDQAARDLRTAGDALLRADEKLQPDLMPEMKRGQIRRALADDVAQTQIGFDPDAGLDVDQDVRQPFDIGREMERDAKGRFKRGTGVRIKPEMVEGADIGEGPIKISQPRAEAMTERLRSIADNALSTLYDMRDQPKLYGGAPVMRDAIEWAEGLDKRLSAAIEHGDVAEQYGLVDDLKRGVQRYTKGATQIAQKANAVNELSLMQDRARAAKWQGLETSLRQGLEDESVFGQAARNQRRINAAWSEKIEASRRFHRELTTDIGRNPDDPFGRELRGIDPEKAGRYTRGLLNPEKDLTHQAVVQYVDATKKLAELAGEVYELSPEGAAAVQEVGQHAGAFRGALDKAAKSLTLANQFEAFQQVHSGGGTAMGVVAGLASHGVAGGLTGLALGKLAGVLTRPADTVMQLATIEKMARESNGRIARALRGFGSGAAKAVKALDTGSYARKSAHVADIMSRPDTLAERIGRNLGDLREKAPRLADAMTEVALGDIQFLHSKLPPIPPGDPFDPKAKPPEPPPGVRDQWLRYYEAIRDPLSVVDDLRDGRLSPEGIEVLKTRRPELFNAVRSQTAEMMAAGKLSDLSKQQRLGLALALDIDIPELSPAYIAARQAAYQKPQDQPQGSPPRGRPVNLTKSTPQLAADRLESGAGS